MIVIGGGMFGNFRHKARMRSNSCINWSTLTGMALSAILKELEICGFDKTRQACQ